jgi:hypothetical protein
MQREVDKLVKSYWICQVSKGAATNARLYLPLPILERPWTNKIADTVIVAQLYFREVYCLHGLPLSIVFDHDTRVLSHFWQCLWRLSVTKLNFSSTYHPQTHGQTKVVNQSLGALLWSLVREHNKSWDTKLFQAEFAYNCSTNWSTGFSPYTIIYGSNPRAPLDLAPILDMKQTHMTAEDLMAQI